MNDLPFHIAQAHDDLDNLAKIKDLPGIQHVYVDTPGWIDLDGDSRGGDPLGRGPAADVLRAVLDMADQVIVPIEPEPLSFDQRAHHRQSRPAPRIALHRRHQQLGPPRRNLRSQSDQRVRQSQRLAAGQHRHSALQTSRARQR